MRTKLVVVCVLIVLLLCACASKTITTPFEFADYKNAYDNINPTRYLRVTEIYQGEILLSRETKERIKNSKAIYEKIVSEVVSVTHPPMSVTTQEYYYADNKLWRKVDNEWIRERGDMQMDTALRLNPNYFESLKITRGGNGSELVADVKRDMVTIFLQESPTFAQDVSIRLVEKDSQLTHFVLSYQSQSYNVTTTVNYFYTQYSIPEVDL